MMLVIAHIAALIYSCKNCFGALRVAPSSRRVAVTSSLPMVSSGTTSLPKAVR